jgi:hypothetical protein
MGLRDGGQRQLCRRHWGMAQRTFPVHQAKLALKRLVEQLMAVRQGMPSHTGT